MSGWQAALWGLVGGLAAGVLLFMTEVKAAGYRWPYTREEVGPRLTFLGCGVLLGALVASAAHALSGAWPAFLIGAGAPAVVRGVASGVEVSEKPPPGAGPGRPAVAARETAEKGVSENAG